MEQQRFCNKCYTPLAPGARFCPECGEPAPQRVIGSCPNCGQPVMEGQTACYSCGTWVADTVVPMAEVEKKEKKPVPTGVWMSLLAVLLVAIIAVTVVLLFQPRDAEKVVLEQERLTMLPGDRLRLEYEVLPENTPDKSVIWRSGNEAVATVKNGEVVAVNVGVCEITVTTVNGLTDRCTVTVSDFAVEALTLSEKEVSLFVKGRHQLACSVLPEEAETALQWSSDDPKVAEVEDGLLKAQGLGSCTVTVTADNGVSASCRVTVSVRREEQLPVGQWSLVRIENRFEETSQPATGVTLVLTEDLTGSVKQAEGNVAIQWWYADEDSEGDYWYDVAGYEESVQMVYSPDYQRLTLYMPDENWVFEPAK